MTRQELEQVHNCVINAYLCIYHTIPCPEADPYLDNATDSLVKALIILEKELLALEEELNIGETM